MKLISFLLIIGLLAGCGGIDFDPYDYKKAEDAKLKKGSYSIRLHSRQIKLEKKIKFQP